MNAPSAHSQWQRLLKNAGNWQGSFTQISPYGEILMDTPTEVALIPQGDDKSAMRQEIRRYPQSESEQTTVLEYSALSRATLFFDDGAFSQGSMQWGPFSEFGAELGLIEGDRRLRVVQQFNKSGELDKITLIRERLEGSVASERKPLIIEDLIGCWKGEAVTQYADLRPEQTYSTQLIVESDSSESDSSNRIRQTLSFGAAPPITSTGILKDQRILFTEGTQPVQVLLLPDGGSSTCPTTITPRQPIFLEAGWLLAANVRQRLIRQYDAAGTWVSLTLVIERRAQ